MVSNTGLPVFQNAGVHKSVKPHILSVFGDVALAIGPFFKNYLEVVLTTLQQATQAQVDKVCLIDKHTHTLQEKQRNNTQKKPEFGGVREIVCRSVAFLCLR